MQNAELLEELGVEVVKIKKEWIVSDHPLFSFDFRSTTNSCSGSNPL
jgi:hypothetical protein